MVEGPTSHPVRAERARHLAQQPPKVSTWESSPLLWREGRRKANEAFDGG